MEKMALKKLPIEGHLLEEMIISGNGKDCELVPRYFQWERGGLDAHRMMTGDDTGGDVWTVAGAWEGLACSRGAA